jgi:hypothetical protein
MTIRELRLIKDQTEAYRRIYLEILPLRPQTLFMVKKQGFEQQTPFARAAQTFSPCAAFCRKTITTI